MSKKQGVEFKDIMPPAGEKLDVVVKDRDGNEIGVILDLGTPHEVRFDKKPLLSHSLAEEANGSETI